MIANESQANDNNVYNPCDVLSMQNYVNHNNEMCYIYKWLQMCQNKISYQIVCCYS